MVATPRNSKPDVSRKNPAHSVIGRYMKYDISLFHVTRSVQVLDFFQRQGRFGQDFDTFVGAGGGGSGGIARGTADRDPPNTKRRDIESLFNQTYLERYHPFPGRIYFTQATGADMLEAVLWYLQTFLRRAPRMKSSDAHKKNHPFRYSQSLVAYVDGTRYDPTGIPAALENAGRETLVELINIAPHSAALEVESDVQSDIGRRAAGRYDTMYPIAREAQARFSPAVQVGFDYIVSSDIGIAYGPGTGGPSASRARATGRGKRYEERGGGVYALPRVSFAVSAEGASNLKFRAPAPRRSRRR